MKEGHEVLEVSFSLLPYSEGLTKEGENLPPDEVRTKILRIHAVGHAPITRGKMKSSQPSIYLRSRAGGRYIEGPTRADSHSWTDAQRKGNCLREKKGISAESEGRASSSDKYLRPSKHPTATRRSGDQGDSWRWLVAGDEDSRPRSEVHPSCSAKNDDQ